MCIGKRHVIDAHRRGNFSRMINHSCNPYCTVEKWIDTKGLPCRGIFTLRDILAGEEITFDYAAEFRENKTPTVCYCGESNCKGTIGKNK